MENGIVQRQIQEGVIPELTKDIVKIAELKANIARKEVELRESSQYIELMNMKESLAAYEEHEAAMRDKGKELMLMNGLKKVSLLDGTEVQLNRTPGAIVIGDESKVPEKYWKEKTNRTIDKTLLKNDFNEGVPLDPSIYVESDYKFVIKQK